MLKKWQIGGSKWTNTLINQPILSQIETNLFNQIFREENNMRIRRTINFILVVAFALSISVAQGVQAAPLQSRGGGDDAAYTRACPGPDAPGDTHCYARLSPNATTSPTGLSPTTIKAAYNFSTSMTAGVGKTIAIVDAYDDT